MANMRAVQSLNTYAWLALDNIWAIFVIGVLVVFYWRGTWELLDHNLYPDDGAKSTWICVAIGNGGLFFAAMLQESLNKHMTSKNATSKWILWFFFNHLFSYVMGFFSVCHWRGIWHGLNHYTGKTDESYIYSLVVGQILLWLLRSAKMVSAPPNLCLHDTGDDVFTCESRFHQTPKNRELYVLDHLLNVVVIWNSVVLMWRGPSGSACTGLLPSPKRQSANTERSEGQRAISEYWRSEVRREQRTGEQAHPSLSDSNYLEGTDPLHYLLETQAAPHPCF
ncbi:hypothetical protein CAPTEDRAFT_205957 [Capitella teleta]|uniref:Uncharacterized protein n=1 Tax=Capitella teleta TaxID=283909 RepID=R7TJX2_CAPTE|nr:hypothetical protein CAPTEDRAFT_205957 [Capitella teleta]|eukprot:ELT91400.1 hypothetical protein CAPTEDRAFT_205957 [Capitella teleta]